MAKQKIHSTTQDFTEIIDLKDNIVFFKGGNACAVLEVSSINFYLLSTDEQNARMYAYVSLLNSLSFYIQILIISKKIDLSAYLKMLDEKVANEKNPKILEYLKHYQNFIHDLVKGEELLDKKIYIVVPFSQLELGAIAGAQKTLSKEEKNISEQKMKEVIVTKKNQILTQIQRLGLQARQLETDELVKLFYEIFNEDIINFDFQERDVKNIIL